MSQTVLYAIIMQKVCITKNYSTKNIYSEGGRNPTSDQYLMDGNVNIVEVILDIG